MKENYRKLVVLALLVPALSGAALAQDLTPKVRAYIPFSFYAGTKMMPAGTYTIYANHVNNSVGIFQRNTGVGTFLLAWQIDGSQSGRSFLTFRSNGEGTYVLEKIEGPDLGLGFATKQALSHVALNTPASGREVVIAALGDKNYRFD